MVFTILKNIKVNGKDDISYIMENKKLIETTNQVIIGFDSSLAMKTPTLNEKIRDQLEMDLVGAWAYPSEKYDFVWKKIIQMFQTTKQITIIFPLLLVYIPY